jgi:hypothetical protein
VSPPIAREEAHKVIRGLMTDARRRVEAMSSDFVRAGQISAQSLGAFALKGVSVEQEIFVPVQVN